MNIKAYILFTLILAVFTANGQLTINPRGFITINPTGSMYVGTTLNINSDASGSGYWVDRTTGNDVTITGNINIERYIGQGGWHNTAAPVNSALSNVYTGTDLVFYYDESIILNDWNFGWVWYSGALSVMRGYDVYSSSPITVDYTASNGGHLNTGSYTIAVTRTNVTNGEAENRKGWNLLGNPYPSPVDWLMESGWNKSDINDAKYIWNPSNNNYTIFLGGTNPTGINGGTQFIPSNQGFWVQALQTGTVEVNNAARVGIAASTPDYYKNSNTISNELRLTALGNGYSDETMIRFLPETTQEFDINKDACKLFSPNDSVPQLYTNTGNTLLAINSLPEITDGLAIPLNFICGTLGYYSIAIDSGSSIDNSEKVYLKDLKDEKLINLSTEHRYTFFHTTNDYSQRFILFFNPSKDVINNSNTENFFTVSSHKNRITIIKNSSELNNCKVFIYNLFGQVITSFTLNEEQKTTVTINAPTGYYIASIISGSGISNSKIFIVN